MLTVKISTAARDWPWLRQTPGGSGVWGNCRFVVDEPVESCDFWVVYDGLLEPETTSCPPGATLLITAEPPGVKLYRPGFVAQFGAVRTTHRQLVHPHVTLGQPALPWHVGRRQQAHRNIAFTWNYDELKGFAGGPKDRLISVISSDKVQTAGSPSPAGAGAPTEGAFRRSARCVRAGHSRGGGQVGRDRALSLPHRTRERRLSALLDREALRRLPCRRFPALSRLSQRGGILSRRQLRPARCERSRARHRDHRTGHCRSALRALHWRYRGGAATRARSVQSLPAPRRHARGLTARR